MNGLQFARDAVALDRGEDVAARIESVEVVRVRRARIAPVPTDTSARGLGVDLAVGVPPAGVEHVPFSTRPLERDEIAALPWRIRFGILYRLGKLSTEWPDVEWEVWFENAEWRVCRLEGSTATLLVRPDGEVFDGEVFDGEVPDESGRASAAFVSTRTSEKWGLAARALVSLPVLVLAVVYDPRALPMLALIGLAGFLVFGIAWLWSVLRQDVLRPIDRTLEMPRAWFWSYLD